MTSALDAPAPATTPDDGLADALAMGDARGILTVYAPAGRTDAVRARIDALVRPFAGEWPDADMQVVRRRLRDVDVALARRDGSAGRALFVGLESGEIVNVGLAAPPAEDAALDRTAHVRRLVAALQAGRPAGVVELSRDRLSLAVARGLRIEELDAVDLAAQERIRDARRGGPGAPSTPARQPGPSRDEHEDRRRERMLTAAGAFAEHVGQIAEAEGWDLVVARGEPRLLGAFADRFPSWHTDLVEGVISGSRRMSAHALSGVTHQIATARAERVKALINDVAQNPAAVWGSDGVLAALERRRLELVLVADDLEAAAAERVVRQTLASGAQLVMVPAGALGPLQVVARARW